MALGRHIQVSVGNCPLRARARFSSQTALALGRQAVAAKGSQNDLTISNRTLKESNREDSSLAVGDNECFERELWSLECDRLAFIASHDQRRDL